MPDLDPNPEGSTAAAAPPAGRWLNRNVLAIGFADFCADTNYEMVLAVLPLFITVGLGAPVAAVGIVEGVADGSSAVVKLLSGWYSDRIAWRRRLAAGGYGGTVVGFGLMALLSTWPQVVGARGIAWIGRGLRQPIRNAILAASVAREDAGKAFGFHEAMDTAGAVLGPAIAFALLFSGHGFRTIFWVAVVPGLGAALAFTLLTRDPRRRPGVGLPLWRPLPAGFWRLIGSVAVFGSGNFAIAFFTLRAQEMLQPGLPKQAALAGAVAFYLFHNAIGSAAAFPAGWLADRIGRAPVLVAGYLCFVIACLVAIAAHGPLGVALLAIPVGIHAPVVKATESSLASSLVSGDAHGAAFGVLDGVNGAGDLVSSLVTGALWTVAGPVAGLAYGAVIGLAGAVALTALRPERPR